MRFTVFISIAILHQVVITEALETDDAYNFTKHLLHIFKTDPKKWTKQIQINKYAFDAESTKYSKMRHFNEPDNRNESSSVKKRKNDWMDSDDIVITKTGFITKDLKYEGSINVDFKVDFKLNGLYQLKLLGYNLKNYLNMTSDIKGTFQNAFQNYNTEMNAYFRTMRNHKKLTQLEREFYVLHIIENANRIFANACYLFSHNIIRPENYSALDFDYSKSVELINNAIEEEKKNNLKYICEVLFFCRYYPTYSDRIAVVISHIIRLRDEHFEKFVIILKDIIESKAEFFKDIMGDYIASTISSKIQTLFKNIKNLRTFFESVRQLISRRYFMFKIEDNKRAIAFRILIDMIDKAFNALGEEILKIYFDSFVGDLNDWNGNYNYMHSKLNSFCNNIEEVLQFHWDWKSKNEVKVLTVVMLYGTSNNTIKDELLTNGSHFVQGNTIFSDEGDALMNLV